MNIAKILAENLIFLAHSMPPETGAAQLNLLSVIVHRKTKNTNPLLKDATSATSDNDAAHQKNASTERKKYKPENDWKTTPLGGMND